MDLKRLRTYDINNSQEKDLSTSYIFFEIRSIKAIKSTSKRKKRNYENKLLIVKEKL